MFFSSSKHLQALTSEKNSLQATLTALSSSSAMISFTPDGEILEANELFLNTLGYTLPEIVGKHHRLFVLDKEADSADYRLFWQQLAQGSFQSRRFARRHKNGNTVWIEASYNPVFDTTGKVVKVVKLAMDVTGKVQAELENEAKLAAISRAMAVIEFDTQGNVLNANDNFLRIMGYSLAEIVGQHHRMFASNALTQAPAYQQFWQQLARGEMISGTCERIAKQGKTVWLEASYNPIFDTNGKVVKVIKYASDVTLNETNKQQLADAVSHASKALNQMSEGDLTVQMSGSFTGDLQHLQTCINQLGNALRTAFCRVAGQSSEVAMSAHQVSDSNQTLSDVLQRQAGALEETASAMEEINQQVHEASYQAQQSTSLVQQSAQTVNQSMKAMQSAIQTMQSIKDASQQITGIVGIIDSIAFQTNLLALNAAVEAARAGEHGRGFAVVASEVRTLAGKSADAAQDIKKLIAQTAERINKGTEEVEHTGKMLSDVVSSVASVEGLIVAMSHNAKEQTHALSQIGDAINTIDKGAQQSAALVEESAALSEHLGEVANKLDATVGEFSLGDCHQQSHSRAPSPVWMLEDQSRR